jgi:hypothetical protein
VARHLRWARQVRRRLPRPRWSASSSAAAGAAEAERGEVPVAGAFPHRRPPLPRRSVVSRGGAPEERGVLDYWASSCACDSASRQVWGGACRNGNRHGTPKVAHVLPSGRYCGGPRMMCED